MVGISPSTLLLLPSYQAPADLPSLRVISGLLHHAGCHGHILIAHSILGPQKPLGVALDLSVLTHCTDTPSLVSYWLRDVQSLPTPSNEAQIHSALGFPVLSKGSINQLQQLPCSCDSVQGKGPSYIQNQGVQYSSH